MTEHLRPEQSGDRRVGAREAARQLGVHENTIRNWEQRGLIKATRLPSGVRRFSQADVERMRREMWSQFAPATELPEPCRPTKSGRIIEGDSLLNHPALSGKSAGSLVQRVESTGLDPKEEEDG